jgi:hypothetical protein
MLMLIMPGSVIVHSKLHLHMKRSHYDELHSQLYCHHLIHLLKKVFAAFLYHLLVSVKVTLFFIITGNIKNIILINPEPPVYEWNNSNNKTYLYRGRPYTNYMKHIDIRVSCSFLAMTYNLMER